MDWRNKSDIVYCTRCVISNQRPRITFNAAGVCSACQHAERKRATIDWAKRESELVALLDSHRSTSGGYDVIVPVSGGKDSSFVAHQLKYKYGMRPLCVTWSPNVYTDIGWRNLQAFIASGFDHILGSPNGKVNRQLARLAFERMGDPFQPFIYGVKAFPMRMAVKYGVKLIMYAEDGEVEYGGETKNADRGTVDVSGDDMRRTYFSGVAPEDWVKEGIRETDLLPYMLPSKQEMEGASLDYRYFAHYKKWIPQENYYYAAEHCGFQANPMRNEGTYSKYASLDDRIDGFHYYLGFIKFGIGRATSDAAHEIRDGHLTREEGVALVRKYDGEFPQKHYHEFLEYIGISERRFHEVVDSFRKPHVWDKVDGEWRVKSQVT